MGNAADLDLLLAAINRDLPDQSAWPEPVEWRNSLALCALNSVFSLNRKSAIVRNVLNHYRQYRKEMGADPNRDSGDDLLTLMDSEGGPKAFSLNILDSGQVVSGRAGKLRGEAVYEALTKLKELGVTTTEQLLDEENSGSREAENAWLSVKGLGAESWKYLLMNAGDPNKVKADTMLQRFVSRAIGRDANAQTTEALVLQAAEKLDVPPRDLDRAIWVFESPDTKKKPATKGSRKSKGGKTKQKNTGGCSVRN